MIQNDIINPQPRSETPPSLAAPHGWGASGFWTGMDNSRQERVGRTYEIARRPSKPEAHRVYIRGIKDDLLAQITREDSSLLISDKSESLNADRLALSSGILKSISICKYKSVGCGQYIKNASKFYLNKYVVDGLYHSKYKNLRMIVGWGIVILLLYWLVYSQMNGGFGNIYRFVSPLLLTSILFTFTSGCGIFTTGGGQGDAPWLLLGSGINNDTPSVRDDGMVVSGGGGGIPFTVPVTGMYFVHSDHLGSVSFLTNGRGAIVAGGEFGGKSDIQYKPYGEIDRPHSSGPDISKYKYTGQEEDKESGLLYYKARYYDPGLGRFLQADIMVFPESVQGMNRMMYVEGNPVKFSDATGYKLSNSWATGIIAYMHVNEQDVSQLDKFIAVASAYAMGRAKDRRKSNNFLDISLNTGRFFQGIERNSGIGRAVTHNWKLYRNSDFGRAYTRLWQNMVRSVRDPRGYIESSDLARSDLGRLVTRNRQAILTTWDASGLNDLSDGGPLWIKLGYPLIGKIMGFYSVLKAYYEICFNQQACIMGR